MAGKTQGNELFAAVEFDHPEKIAQQHVTPSPRRPARTAL
jgi:hypothetical protein